MTYDEWKKVESEALKKWQGIIERVDSSSAKRSKRQSQYAAVGFLIGFLGMCVACAIARVFAPQIASMAGYDPHQLSQRLGEFIIYTLFFAVTMGSAIGFAARMRA